MPNDFVVGAFYRIAVVSGAFDDAGAGAFPAFPVRSFIDFLDRFGERQSQCPRGKMPPDLWSVGG